MKNKIYNNMENYRGVRQLKNLILDCTHLIKIKKKNNKINNNINRNNFLG